MQITIDNTKFGSMLGSNPQEPRSSSLGRHPPWGANFQCAGQTFHPLPPNSACSGGHTNIVKVLLQSGADSNTQGEHPGTPLQSACSRGHISIVRLLLLKGAGVNARDDTSNISFHLASMNGHLEVVQSLLEKGVDPHVQNKSLQTPLDLARLKGHDTIVATLSVAASIHSSMIYDPTFSLVTLQAKGSDMRDSLYMHTAWYILRTSHQLLLYAHAITHLQVWLWLTGRVHMSQWLYRRTSIVTSNNAGSNRVNGWLTGADTHRVDVAHEYMNVSEEEVDINLFPNIEQYARQPLSVTVYRGWYFAQFRWQMKKRSEALVESEREVLGKGCTTTRSTGL
ncbi:ankyrin [Paxillus ammoniavirescens]|nr:ankyrin [Paxillus ammoniavirescens]